MQNICNEVKPINFTVWCIEHARKSIKHASYFSFDEKVYVRHVTGFVNVVRLHGREEGVTFQNEVSSFSTFSNVYKNILNMFQSDKEHQKKVSIKSVL